MSVYPIGFSIHHSKIVEKVPEKTKLLAFIEPGNLSTYIYDNEKDYYQDYATSFFALTKKKGGWDCMRHYEILANGCIPLFLNLENCPPSIMTHLPKEIIIKSRKIYNKMKDSDDTEKETQKCYQYIEQLLQHTRQYLTNSSMAKYILEKTNKLNSKKILYLSQDIYPDYLRCVTLVGFKELYQEECHDYPKIPHIYQDYSNSKKLYGKGISYTNLIPKEYHNDEYDETIIQDIESHTYDLIIYGSYHRGLIFWDVVNKFYQPDEIILLCGEDDHNCDYKSFTNRGYDVFVRELI